MHINHWS